MAQSNARKKFIRLIQKFLAGKTSPEEEQFIEAYYESFDTASEQSPLQSDDEKELLAQEMKTAIWQQIEERERSHPVIPINKHSWRRIAVAASIVVLASIPVYYFIIHKPAPQVIAKVQQQTSVVQDALPGGNKATLTLADGTVIDLDKAANGTIANEGETKVKKRSDGQLEYKEILSEVEGVAQNSERSRRAVYNTLTTPAGGQYYLELPDGSKVWLNAASSIRYPTVFNSNERLVQLSGEAYFEIKKNHDKPFRVHFTAPIAGGGAREGLIEVLGTHFNVNAYGDEAMIKTTLLEGQIREWANPNDVHRPERSVVLKPGQQAQIKNTAIGSDHIRVINDADTEGAIAWKNGIFYFDNVDIQAIMRQLARWYNVQVVFKGKVPTRRFAGQVSRSMNLSQVLKILELSKVHFSIEGEVVTVLP
ncbi:MULTISPECIES: FecR family protein [Niastella]|uniref:FecR family protein n=1 Tax=Niastella soli TaxID=2821487 RepID=A0ABS3Z1S3_9BACT|nr:FecR family protein [Niastella soli]MBO9204112.1 FecR family protein [Niastella soli]